MEQLHTSGEMSPESPPFVFRLRGEPPYQPSYSISHKLQQSLHEATLYEEWLKYLKDEGQTDVRGVLEEGVRWRIGRLSGYFAELISALPEERDVRVPWKLWLGRRRKVVFHEGATIRWMCIRSDLLCRQPFANGKLVQTEHHLGLNISRHPVEDLQKLCPEQRVDAIRSNVQGAMKYVSGIYDGMLLPDRTTTNRIFPFHYPEQD